MPMTKRILFVESEPAARFATADSLRASGYAVDDVASCAAVREAIRRSAPDLAIVSHQLPEANALDALPALTTLEPPVPLLVLVDSAAVELGTRAVQLGAEQLLIKPIAPALLLSLVRGLFERERDREHYLARRGREQRERLDPFVGTSATVRALAEQARRIAGAHSPVLISGGPGVGKGVLARWIHESGPRGEEVFAELHCAGLSREPLEFELFGRHDGGDQAPGTPGLFELAHRGTVFLDEIGAVDVRAQPMLLKVIEEQRFRRLGELRDRRVSSRLVSATRQDLAALVRTRLFREELFMRVSTLPLHVPSLCERGEDISELARVLVRTVAVELGCPGARLSDDALRAMEAYPWPGNLRELRNVLERALLVVGGGELRARDLRLERRVRPRRHLARRP